MKITEEYLNYKQAMKAEDLRDWEQDYTFPPHFHSSNLLSFLLHRLTLDSDGYSGGDSVVAIILDVTRVISTGAPRDVC